MLVVELRVLQRERERRHWHGALHYASFDMVCCTMINEHRTNLLTVDEAADRLRQSPQSVRRRIASGELLAFRVGSSGPYRVPATAVERLLQPTTKEPA